MKNTESVQVVTRAVASTPSSVDSQEHSKILQKIWPLGRAKVLMILSQKSKVSVKKQLKKSL